MTGSEILFQPFHKLVASEDIVSKKMVKVSFWYVKKFP